MDPVTAVSAATGIVKLLGLDQVVGRWLGGDKGAAMAGKVVEVAQLVTGASTPEAAMETIAADQAAAAALRQEILRLSDAESERETNDRASARAMQIAALQQDDVQSKRFVYRFAWVWSMFAMLYILGVTFLTIPQGHERYADLVLGFLLGTVIATILTFFFGSSNSSKANVNNMQAMLAKLTDRS